MTSVLQQRKIKVYLSLFAFVECLSWRCYFFVCSAETETKIDNRIYIIYFIVIAHINSM